MGKKKDIIQAALTAGQAIENTGKGTASTGKRIPPPRPENLKPAWEPGQSGNPGGRPRKAVATFVKTLKTIRTHYTDMQIQALSQDLLVTDPKDITKALKEKRGTALELLLFSMWDAGLNTGDFRLTYAILQLAGHGKLLKDQPGPPLPPAGDDSGDENIPQRAVVYLPPQREET